MKKIVTIVSENFSDIGPLVLSDGDFTVIEILRAIRSATGVAVFPPFPGFLARPLAVAIDTGFSLVGRGPGPGKRVIHRLTENFVVRAHRYNDNFGALPPMNLQEAFAETVAHAG